MTTDAQWIHIDPAQILHILEHEAVERVTRGDEVVLDFGAIRRIGPGEVQALEALAVLAAARSLKVALRGVNSDIYKVLKLLKLSGKFSFPA